MYEKKADFSKNAENSITVFFRLTPLPLKTPPPLFFHPGHKEQECPISHLTGLTSKETFSMEIETLLPSMTPSLWTSFFSRVHATLYSTVLVGWLVSWSVGWSVGWSVTHLFFRRFWAVFASPIARE